jgi:hypothetical protein
MPYSACYCNVKTQQLTEPWSEGTDEARESREILQFSRFPR